MDQLGKDNCKMRREAFKFLDLLCLVLEVWLIIFELIIMLQKPYSVANLWKSPLTVHHYSIDAGALPQWMVSFVSSAFPHHPSLHNLVTWKDALVDVNRGCKTQQHSQLWRQQTLLSWQQPEPHYGSQTLASEFTAFEVHPQAWLEMLQTFCSLQYTSHVRIGADQCDD